ncbi:MAG: tyrosine-type recombinase/integrase [Bacteroidales bacterium]
MAKKICELAKIYDAGGDLSKKWFVFFSYRSPKSGKMIRFREFKGLQTQKSFEKRIQASEKLRDEINIKLKAGWNPFTDNGAIYEDDLTYTFAARRWGKARSGNRTFNFMASEYLKDIGGLADTTVSTYRSKLRIFDQWLDKNSMSGNDISSINNEIITAFFHFLIDDQKLSSNSTNKYKILLTGVFDLAIHRKLIMYNPVHHIPVNTRVNDQTPRPIHENDIEILKQALKSDPQLWLAVQFEYYCFLRPGNEVRLMKIEWIDFHAGHILVPKTFAKTKNDKLITIPNQFLKILIEEYKLNTYPSYFYVFSENGMPGTRHLGKNNLRFRFVKIRKELGMPDKYKLYSWKHTGNIRAKNARIPIQERQFQNGHTSEKTTEIYTKNLVVSVNQSIKRKFPTL